MDDVTAVILAGGGSRRFGADKANFRVDGRPMIRHVYEAVSPLAAQVLISVGPTIEIPTGLHAERVPDRVPGCGPLAGVDAALMAASTEWLLVTACDMPYLTTEALRTLAGGRTPSSQAVVAHDESGRRHPLCACYRKSIHSTVEERLRTGRLAVHELLDELQDVVTVPLPATVLRNVNEPGDLSAT